MTHRDSLGVVQDIRPGDVNWMTAGRGIVHSERTPADGEPLAAGQLHVFPGREPVRLEAGAAVGAMAVGGAAIGHRLLWWNFVSTSRERIEQAKADWASGRFPPVPGEHESIPLPER